MNTLPSEDIPSAAQVIEAVGGEVAWVGKFHRWSLAFNGDDSDICATVRYDGRADADIQKQLLDALVKAAVLYDRQHRVASPVEEGNETDSKFPEQSFVVTLHACPERGHTAYWFELQETIRVLGRLFRIERIEAPAIPPSVAPDSSAFSAAGTGGDNQSKNPGSEGGD